MNKISIALYTVGWLSIVGGVVMAVDAWGNTLVIDPVPWLEMIFNIGIGSLIGIAIFGFAEIINLLDKISKK